jgi:hypothetical protein
MMPPWPMASPSPEAGPGGEIRGRPVEARLVPYVDQTEARIVPAYISIDLLGRPARLFV